MAFGAGGRRLKGDCEPRKIRFHFTFISPLNRFATTQPPPKHHTPRSACGLSFKGTSLGLRLDLTASWYPPREASPKGRLRGVRVPRAEKEGQLSRGAAPSSIALAEEGAPPNPTEKKLLTHHQDARNRKRSARLADIGR